MRLPPVTWLALAVASTGPAACRPEPPSVLIVTLDTTRADHLGPYGGDVPTPAYDRLAAEGVVFERATTPVPLTTPAHASILTGLEPPRHGVLDNGTFVLHDDVVTLAERLRAAGWHTGAFTSALPTQARWGLDQGFEHYDDRMDETPERLDFGDERQAGDVAAAARAWIAETPGPVFVWVHLFDAHWPYTPPPGFEQPGPFGDYDGEIAYAAHAVGELLDAWDARFDRSVVVVTADHGEGLGDGGERTHGFLLHDGTIRVPLLVRARGLPEAGLAPGTRVADPVSTVDIAPTLLDLLGLPGADGLDGRDLRDGGSARPYSESRTGQFLLGLAPLFAFTTPDGRYTEGAWGAWYPFLGDGVATEPAGVADLDALHADLAAMRERLDRDAPATRTVTPDADTLARLAALGYLSTVPEAPPGTVDPREVIDLLPLTWRVRGAVQAGRVDVAARMVDVLAARLPDAWGIDDLRGEVLRASGRPFAAIEAWTSAWRRSHGTMIALKIADVSADLGDFDEAEAWYREVLDRVPLHPQAEDGLARVLLMRGEPEAAELAAVAILARQPDHVEVRLTLAEALLARGEVDEALEIAAEARRRIPLAPRAIAIHARALWAAGRPEEAIDAMQEALRRTPWLIGPRVELARWLLEVGRHAEAVRTARPAALALPDDPEITALADEAEAALADEIAHRPPVDRFAPDLADEE